MLILRLYILNDNDEVVHYCKVLGLLGGQKSEFLPQLNLYILGRSLNLANGGKAKINKGINKVNGFGYFKRDLVIPGPTLPINTEVCPFLKHNIYGWLFFPNIIAAYDTLYKMFNRLFIIRCNSNVSSLVPVSLR